MNVQSPRMLTAYAVLTAVFVLFVSETASWAALSLLRGHPVTRAELYAAQQETAGTRPEMTHDEWLKDTDTERRILHPFAGFIHSYNPIEQYKRIGSGSAVIVGISGGSVARHFAVEPRARAAFEERLKEIPAFSGREVILVNLAADGYRQPQELQIMSYMIAIGTRFDVFIELDGANDLPYYFTNRSILYAYEYPSFWRERMAALRERLSARYYDRLTRTRSGAAALLQSSGPLSGSFTANALWTGADLALRRLLAAPAERGEYERHAPYEIFGARTPEENTPEAEEALELALWMRSSEIMYALAQSQNISYFHFLQPNQYVAGSKPIGPEEQLIALGNPDFQRVIPDAFIKLRAAGRTLKNRIPFYDLTQIFADVSEPLYIDSCCHLNATGSLLLGQAMADVIVRELQGQ